MKKRRPRPAPAGKRKTAKATKASTKESKASAKASEPLADWFGVEPAGVRRPARAAKKPEAAASSIEPEGLSATSLLIWDRVNATYDDMTDAEKGMLLEGLRSRDRASEARELIEEEGILIRDRFGAIKANPACAVERDARAAFVAVMCKLNLNEHGLEDG